MRKSKSNRVTREVAEDEKYRPMTIELSPQAHGMIEHLFRTGLFGLSPEDVVERLLCEQLRKYADVKR